MRRLVIIPLLACLVLGAFPGVFAQEAQPGKSEEDNGYAQISIFAKTLELLRQDYVDENKTSYHDLVTAAMKGMLSSLDPHSQFMDPSDFRDMQDDTRSRFNGLGIEVSMKNGLPTVITAMEDTPAAKAGVLSGDQILRINGISTERMDLQDAINVLRGPAGAKVTLTLLRPSTNEIKEYTLQRAEIKIQSVKGARLLDAELTGPFKIGYVRLIQFNEPTAEELSRALDDLQKQGMQALILDLRNNPGGLLNSAVDVCAQFLPPNTKVVSTQGRVVSQQRDYSTSGAKKERPELPDGVTDQRRERERSGDRCWSAQGFAPRRACRRNHFRKRFRAECHAIAGRFGGAFYHCKILYAEQTSDSGQWRDSEYSCCHDRRPGTCSLCIAQCGKHEFRGRDQDYQEQRCPDVARNRCAEGRHDLCATKRAESRSSKEIMFAVIPSRADGEGPPTSL